MRIWGDATEPLNTMDVLPSNDEFGIFSGEDLFKCSTSKKPIVDGLIYEGDVMFITASAGIGKSILALQIACCISSGTPFLDTYSTSKGRVLYIQTEGDRCETVARLIRMTKKIPVDKDNIYHLNLPGLPLNKPSIVDALIKDLKKASPKFDVIILDPLYTTIKGSLASDEAVTDWVREVRRIKGEFGASLMVLHHEGKDIYTQCGKVERSLDLNDMFGSTFWRAFVTSHYKMLAENDVHKLVCGKFRSGKDALADKVVMKLVEPDPLYFKPITESLRQTTVEVLAVMHSLERPARRRELEERVTRSKVTVWRALKDLENMDLIEWHTADSGLTYYKIKEKNLNKAKEVLDEYAGVHGTD